MSVVTDPLPQIVKGVPTDIRSIDAVIDRPNFMFNPTNCSEEQSTSTITGSEGAAVALPERFEVGGCRELAFAPTLTASTKGKAGRSKGASLTVKMNAKHGEANIHKVDLQLPRALPSRDSTLKLACLAVVFAKDPANCPPASFIGTGVARTPVLSAPLTGPAIIVSHGGAAFPDVEYVLQGEGVRIVLDGKTNIEHNITYSNFETVPDEPITSFETTLPEGPHSTRRLHQGRLLQSLWAQARDADDDRRAKRRADQAEHDRRSQRLPKPHKAEKKHARKRT